MTIGGVETLLLSLAGKDIHPCDACDTCHNTNTCHVADDVTPVIEEMKKADVIIVSAPTYIHNLSAQAKILFDRTNCLFNQNGESLLRDKIGAAIVVGQERQGGKAYALSSILMFFLAHHMIVVGGSLQEGYPGVSAWTFGSTAKNAVMKDEQGLNASEEIGWRVAKFAKLIKGRRYPSGNRR
jgi:multimeric flavodoxin WrbA